MKTMIFTDLLTTKNSLITLLGLDVILGVFLTFTMQTLIGATAAMTVIVPLMYLFSIGVYDEMNDWEGFRLTLPSCLWPPSPLKLAAALTTTIF